MAHYTHAFHHIGSGMPNPQSKAKQMPYTTTNDSKDDTRPHRRRWWAQMKDRARDDHSRTDANKFVANNQINIKMQLEIIKRERRQP